MIQNYLSDVIQELIDEAIRLKSEATSDIEVGMLTAYYQIISRLLNQAEAFGLSNDLPPDIRNFDLEQLI